MYRMIFPYLYVICPLMRLTRLMSAGTNGNYNSTEAIPKSWQKQLDHPEACQVIDQLSFDTFGDQICPGNNVGVSSKNCQNTALMVIYEADRNVTCSIFPHQNMTATITSYLSGDRSSIVEKCNVEESSAANPLLQQFDAHIRHENRSRFVKNAFCLSCNGEFLNCTNVTESGRNITSEFRLRHTMAVDKSKISVAIVLVNISIFFLLLHFIIFQQLPQIRTLPQKNLTAFSITLLLYLVCYEIATIYHGCQLPALFCHVLLISCYTWMLILSYDCWSSMRAVTKHFQLTYGKQTKKFVSYCFVCWVVVPATVVAMALYFRFAPEDTILVYLKPMPAGKDTCSRMEMQAFNVFTVVPALCLFLGNVAFYSHCAYAICRGGHKSEAAGSRSNLKACLRLAVMVNLSWILEFAGVLTDSELVQFCYIIFIVSQGIFIFFMFTFRQKILRLLLNKHKDNRVISSVISVFVRTTVDAEET